MEPIAALDAIPPVLAFAYTTELIFVGFLFFLLFGAKKVPELMRSLGRAQGEYQHAKKEFEREVNLNENDPLEKTRRKAEALGIKTKGKDLDELQRAIAAAGGDTAND